MHIAVFIWSFPKLSLISEFSEWGWYLFYSRPACRFLKSNKEIIKMSLQIFFFFNTDIYNLLLWTIFIQITTVIFPLSHIPLITFSPVNKFPVFCLLVFLSFFLFFNLHSFQYASPWFSLDVWSDLPPYYLVMKFLYCSPLLGQMISGCPISSYLFYCIFLNYLICHLFWIKGCKESLVTSVYSLYSALRLKFRLVILYRKKSDNNWAYGRT